MLTTRKIQNKFKNRTKWFDDKLKYIGVRHHEHQKDWLNMGLLSLVEWQKG